MTKTIIIACMGYGFLYILSVYYRKHAFLHYEFVDCNYDELRVCTSHPHALSLFLFFKFITKLINSSNPVISAFMSKLCYIHT